LKQRLLVTGAEGFIGSHLVDLLTADNQTEIIAVVFADTCNLSQTAGKVRLCKCDVTRKGEVSSLIKESNPDVIYHLAAQSLLSNSWDQPEQTFLVNVLGTLHILESIRNSKPDALIEIVCTSDEYARSTDQIQQFQESHSLIPSTPYGISKLAADMLGLLYWQRFGIKTIRIRPFSIIGPRKTGDAVSDFARGIVEIETGKRSCLKVGNLEAVRDFVDVRDAVKAMRLLAQKGRPGEAYNICSGKGSSVRILLDILKSCSHSPVEILQDTERIRSSDRTSLIGDCSKLKSLGWQVEISLEQTLRDILDYWRKKVLKHQVYPPRGGGVPLNVRTTVYYPGLAESLNNRSDLRLTGKTVGECLADLVSKFPHASSWLFDDHGNLLDNVFVFINSESTRKAHFSDNIKENDILIIALMVSGG